MVQRQPQLPSMNIVTQRITRNRIAEALLKGKTEGHAWKSAMYLKPQDVRTWAHPEEVESALPH